jgi:ribosome-binding factor A
MAKKRVARLNEQLKRELTILLQFEVKDPRVVGVTITDVEVSPDLYHAKVYFSMSAGSDEEERKVGHEGLRAAAGFLRSELGRRLHIRRAPELHFSFDNTLEHAMHIERLLQEARGSASRMDEHEDAGGPDNDAELLDNSSDEAAAAENDEH